MGRRKKATGDIPTPIHGVRVTTYEDYHADMKAFADGKYQFLMVIGPGGTGKTEGAKTVTVHNRRPITCLAAGWGWGGFVGGGSRLW